MPATTENLLKAGNKVARNILPCLNVITRKLSFLLLCYLESNHRSKNDTFLIESSHSLFKTAVIQN